MADEIASEPFELDDADYRMLAEERADGVSWTALAPQFGCTARGLRRAADAYPGWKMLLHEARKEVFLGASTEAVAILRQLIRGGDDKVRLQAAGLLTKLWMTMMRHYPHKAAEELQDRSRGISDSLLRQCREIEAMSEGELRVENERIREIEVSLLANRNAAVEMPKSPESPATAAMYSTPISNSKEPAGPSRNAVPINGAGAIPPLPSLQYDAARENSYPLFGTGYRSPTRSAGPWDANGIPPP